MAPSHPEEHPSLPVSQNLSLLLIQSIPSQKPEAPSKPGLGLLLCPVLTPQSGMPHEQLISQGEGKGSVLGWSLSSLLG